MAPSKADTLKAARLRQMQNLKYRIDTILSLADDVTERTISVNAKLLDNNWLQFKATIESLDGLIVDTEELRAMAGENCAIEDKYIEAKIFMSELEEVEASNSNSASNQTRGEMTDPGIKISRLTITPFSGRYEDWEEFSDICQSCFIKNTNIPAVQKLNQLKSLLTEEPARLIKHLRMRENNFEVAWKTLEDHYNNPCKVVWRYLQRFFEIPQITSVATATEIQNMILITADLITSLPNFEIDTSSWDSIIIYSLLQKLDSTTVNYWHEQRQAKKSVPTYKQFKTFLETRLSVCESKESKRRSISATSTPKTVAPKPFHKSMPKSLLNQMIIKCEICEKDHRTYQCSRLINASYEKRMELVQSKKLCENCLYPHEPGKCTSKYSCRACDAKHHTLLHPLQKSLHTKINIEEEVDQSDEEDQNVSTMPRVQEQEEEDEEDVNHMTLINLCNKTTTNVSMLATALVPVYTKSQTIVYLRALLDQGSETSLISTRAHQMLNTDRRQENIPILAIGNTPAGVIKHSTNIVISSLYDQKYRHSFTTLITKTITRISPQIRYDLAKWVHIQDLNLADPKYFEPGAIDLLLGVREMSEILLPGLIKGDVDTPMAQQTKLGWVLSGTCGTTISPIKCHNIQTQQLSDILRAFWTIEEVEYKPILSKDELAAENHFVKNVKRHRDGKFILRLPFKTNPKTDEFLGRSYEAARMRFFQVEKRLKRNEKHYEDYRKCINEYLLLGHMRLATRQEQRDEQSYYLPHHGVIKESSETTKLRVVFDASCKTSNGKSLNDQLHVGPTIQHDLFTLLIQWRKHKVAITGDIEKMYRQIWVDEEDAKYQRILWRNVDSEPLKEYILLTVTFGTGSAPFQAIRCLFQVADEIENNEPEIAQLIRENFYVDDFLGSHETIEEAINVQTKLQSILDRYGLNLRKWKSNSIEFLNTIDPLLQGGSVEHSFESSCKALGIHWHPQHDNFYFKLNFGTEKRPLTKRVILSETAKIFDPLGWLAPCTVKAKILMQKLWLLPIEWDDKVDLDIEKEWSKFRTQILTSPPLQIPRWLGYTIHNVSTSIHGFADASEEAYAAVVYLRTETNTETTVSLIAAKTKVAPLKRMTIPHLELSAAKLLAELIRKIQVSLKLENTAITAWTDSMVVLGWLSAPSHKWQTFVANRVSQIQEIIAPEHWRHVPTAMNPADCASRGLFLEELRTHGLWWKGPCFLSQSEGQWPHQRTVDSKISLPDQRKTKQIHHVTVETDAERFLNSYSSLSKLLHITAYCLRWRDRQKVKTSILSVDEVQRARKVCIRLIQYMYFSTEIACVRNKRKLPRGSVLRRLNPVLDENNILRVGSRLKEANLNRDQIEPIILPKIGHFTELIIRDGHNRALHAGVQATLLKLRQNYWILGGRETIQRSIKNCTICFHAQPVLAKQKMSNLPHFRVNECRPFTYTGVDFAGYFEVKISTKKNAQYAKAYISLFICLTTKAVHLEVVSALSTDAFLLAFKRFIARKLMPRHMYSDRGTNFIGAKNELPRLFSELSSRQSIEIREILLQDQIEWHLNPAHAPHFGGIWEAGVKSTKYHLKRILGNARLNFEEFTTVVAQIESCLNSRPLYPQTEDPGDGQILTPNHLLFAYGSSVLPEPCPIDIPTRIVNRYHYLRALLTDFWRKWSQEYLSQLMQRSKWPNEERNLRENQIVLIKEDNLPPAKWLYGRIVKVHPGRDGLVRVAEVKCKDSVVSRPIHKLCLLPIVDNGEQNELNITL